MPGSASACLKALSHSSKAGLDCLSLVERRYLPAVMALLATERRVVAAPHAGALLIELSHQEGRSGWVGELHLHSTHISGVDSLHIARHDYFLRAPFLKVYPDKAIPSWVWRKRGWDKERFGGQGMTQNKS